MATPKFRTSASKRDMRRAHHALKQPNPSYCPGCGELKRPHRVCPSCGKYKDASVITVKSLDAITEGFNPNE